MIPVVSLIGSICDLVDYRGGGHGVGVRAAWPRQLIVNGAVNRDYTLVLGLVVLTTVVAVVFNLLVDLAYAWLDPRSATES